MKKLQKLTFAHASNCVLCSTGCRGIIYRTVKKMDKSTKAVVVQAADGTEHTIKVTDQATVNGTKEGFDGLKEGSEVVAR